MPLDQDREGHLGRFPIPSREALQQLPVGLAHRGPGAQERAQAPERVAITV
jgi:hypothetical protein